MQFATFGYRGFSVEVSGLGKRNNIPGEAGFKICRPCLHERAAFFQRISPAVSPFGRIAYNMGKRGLCNLTREGSRFPCPIAKGGTHPVNCGHGIVITQRICHGNVAQRPASLAAGENERIVPIGQWLDRLKNC